MPCIHALNLSRLHNRDLHRTYTWSHKTTNTHVSRHNYLVYSMPNKHPPLKYSQVLFFLIYASLHYRYISLDVKTHRNGIQLLPNMAPCNWEGGLVLLFSSQTCERLEPGGIFKPAHPQSYVSALLFSVDSVCIVLQKSVWCISGNFVMHSQEHELIMVTQKIQLLLLLSVTHLTFKLVCTVFSVD